MPAVVDLHLDAKDSIFLRNLVEEGTAPPAMQLRARILLLKAQGRSTQYIADELHTNRNTVDKWVNRYRNRGKDEPIEKVLSLDLVTGRRGTDPEAKRWIRSIAIEGEPLRKFTERIHAQAEEAGFPQLTTISYVSVRSILKEGEP